MYTLVNEVSYAPQNCNIGYNNSWVHVNNDANRELFAQASYITNFDDLPLTLSATDVTIGAIEIKDWNSNVRADVATAGPYNALRVLTQDLESSIDDVTIGDRNGNYASVNSSTSSLNVNVTNPISTISTQAPVQVDAFGRIRTSNPITLFDSSHRFQDNGLWISKTSGTASASFNANQGLIDLNVNSLSGSSVIRETTKVFSYQPGKSLLLFNTFVMSPSTTNLRQRVGYFNNDNGLYLQLDDNILSFVKRSLVNGNPATETPVSRQFWNGDKLDGFGESKIILDITKAQILWMDIEWLGVGTVRMGFVINGKFIVCHSFHHANVELATYITTANLPLRYEITNKNTTTKSSTLKQICSTVISEGGYELKGSQWTIQTTITSPKSLITAGIYYPVITIRLKSNRLDSIVIPSSISLMGVSTGIYSWRLVFNGTTSGGTGIWNSVESESSVEYKLDATGITGGKTLTSGFFTSNAQGSTNIDIFKDSLFKFQLERDALNNIPYEFSLLVSASTDTELVYGSLAWEEVTR